MQKKLRRLRIERETLRALTPENLEAAAGGLRTEFRTDDSCINSCNPTDSTFVACFSNFAFTLCAGC